MKKNILDVSGHPDTMRIKLNIVRQINRKIIKPTPFGSVGVIWIDLNDNPKIVRVLLSKPGLSAEDRVSELYPDSQASSCAEIDHLATAIKGFLEGEAIEFSLDVADLSLCTEFQLLVLRAEHRIPRGSISTYRLIAEYIGKRNGARAVGNALANDPFPLIVPCHRAIRSDRHLGGYQGGLEMKRALLGKEGIPFDNEGRVSSAHFHYGRIMSNRGNKIAS
ncbi:MAG: methylated-DNA--[protein]-cysteine S-methyltransferase [Pseudomonadota bacterium]